MTKPGRLDSARRKVRLARYAIGALGTAAFVGTALLAKAAHPGHAGRPSTSVRQARLPQEPDAFANAIEAPDVQAVPISPAPAEQAPVVQSSGS